MLLIQTTNYLQIYQSIHPKLLRWDERKSWADGSDVMKFNKLEYDQVG